MASGSDKSKKRPELDGEGPVLKNKSHDTLRRISKMLKKASDDGTLTGDMIAHKTANMTPAELTALYEHLAAEGLGNLSEVAGDMVSLEKEFRTMHATQESWVAL